MTAPTNNTADTNNQVNPSPVPVDQTLDDLINQWEKEGLTLELIVALVMSNPEGLGAMDNCSDSIAAITNQANILSKVQADIISINSVLSKIEAQMGVSGGMNGSKMAAAWSQVKKEGLPSQLQKAYVALYGSKGNNGDLAALSAYKTKYPSLSPVIGAVKNWQGDFDTKINGATASFGTELKNWNANSTYALGQALKYMGSQHYDANHPTPSSQTSPYAGQDYLANWWGDGNTAQTMASSVSQQDTTEVQSLMQLLQGYDSDGQQMLQVANTAKGMMIQNQKTA